jgi:AcrR family transcriptional regulator
MAEIATRSGTATASLYRFFPSKEALADALLLQYANHSLDGLADDQCMGHGGRGFLLTSDLPTRHPLTTEIRPPFGSRAKAAMAGSISAAPPDATPHGDLEKIYLRPPF